MPGRGRCEPAAVPRRPSGAAGSADVVAEADGACWCLNRAELDRLEATHPAAALGLLRMLALDLGEKVTLGAQQLTLVEHL